MKSRARGEKAQHGAESESLLHIWHKQSVLLVSSRHFGWSWLRAQLQDTWHWRVVADVSRPEAAQNAARKYHPDLILLAGDLTDVPLPAMVTRLHEASPESHMVILSDEGESGWTILTCPGVGGCLCWSDLNEENIDVGLVAAGTGLRLVSPSALTSSVERSHVGGTITGERPQLSDREMAVLAARMTGHKDREIAATLHLSLRSIETVIHTLKRKFDAHTSSELSAKARQRGFGD